MKTGLNLRVPNCRELPYIFWCGELLQGHAPGKNFDPSTGRLAVGRMQTSFDLSTGQLSGGIPIETGLKECVIGRKGCMLWPGIWLEQFYDGKVHYFLHLFLLIRAVFPATYRKECEQLLPPGSEPTISIPTSICSHYIAWLLRHSYRMPNVWYCKITAPRLNDIKS